MSERRQHSRKDPKTILVVDDQEETLFSVRILLQRDGHKVLTASGGEEALSLFQPGKVQLVIVDYFMPGMTAEELVEEVRRRDDDVQILLQTGYSGQKPPLEMLRSLAIQGYHDKSEGPDRLLLWVEVALKAHAHLLKVREIEKLKAELLANLSHELRTPIQILVGYVEILATDAGLSLPDHTRELLERMQRQAGSLSELIGNVLSLAKVNSPAEPQIRPIKLGEFEDEIQKLMERMLENRPISFRWEVGGEIPPILVDPRQMSVILRNLLINAAKFTREGEVAVRATTANDGERVVLRIEDTGIGIAPEHRELVFESFRQVDGSDTRRVGGTGLGLALVKRLAHLNDVDIGLDSTPGAGTTFLLSLKTAPCASAPHSSPTVDALSEGAPTTGSLC